MRPTEATPVAHEAKGQRSRVRRRAAVPAEEDPEAAAAAGAVPPSGPPAPQREDGDLRELGTSKPQPCLSGASTSAMEEGGTGHGPCFVKRLPCGLLPLHLFLLQTSVPIQLPAFSTKPISNNVVLIGTATRVLKNFISPLQTEITGCCAFFFWADLSNPRGGVGGLGRLRGRRDRDTRISHGFRLSSGEPPPMIPPALLGLGGGRRGTAAGTGGGRRRGNGGRDPLASRRRDDGNGGADRGGGGGGGGRGYGGGGGRRGGGSGRRAGGRGGGGSDLRGGRRCRGGRGGHRHVDLRGCRRRRDLAPGPRGAADRSVALGGRPRRWQSGARRSL